MVCVTRLLAQPGAPSGVSTDSLRLAMREDGWSAPDVLRALAHAERSGELRRVPEGWRPASWANRPRLLGETSAWRHRLAQ